MLRVLVVDDEQPALDELSWLLRQDQRVATVRAAADGAEALRALEEEPVDALFLDIRMPGLDGLDLARVLARFKSPPLIVFVTAHEDYAVEAFELNAVDYLLKPVREERLAEAVRRVVEVRDTPGVTPEAPNDETIAVELAGVTRFVARSEVRWVEAHGDYARLHTPSGNHLVRVPLTALEERWRDAGFLRIHRSTLVALAHVDEVRAHSGRWSVKVGPDELHVSRRHSRDLRDVLLRRAPNEAGPQG